MKNRKMDPGYKKYRRQKQRRRRFYFFIAFIIISVSLFLQLYSQLPEIGTITSYIPFETTFIYSHDGEILAELHQEENRIVVPLSKISPYLQKAVIASEDARFFYHHGIDPYGMVRAFVTNVLHFRVMQGASTVTQQLSRTLFLTPRRTIHRKISEILLAFQIERRYSKEEILEMYLNNIYWGHNAYGVESAARKYFNCNAKDLNLAQSAILAGILRGPENLSPFKNERGAKEMQGHVLARMVDIALITPAEAEEAKNEPLDFAGRRFERYKYKAPYFTSYVINQLVEKYGKDIVYKGGLRVYTTLDWEKQKIAENVVEKYVSEEGKSYKFTQGALLALDPRTGYIQAMVGGFNFNESEFNRAIQAKRQTGSAFKPFVYATAIDQGIPPGYVLTDEPATYEVPITENNPDGIWEPMNFDCKFRGPVTMRYALEKSLNIPSIKLLEKVGIQESIRTAKKMGVKSELRPDLSLILGASEISLLEITSAYGSFANGGVRAEPVAIRKIVSSDGRILEKHTITEKRILSPNTSAIMVDVMKGVIKRGTGWRAKIGRPAAAKTGTTEEFRDAWFIGFVPQLITGVWVGNDDNASMKGVAEVAVCPRMWKAFMRKALKNEPVLAFPKPKGMIDIEICLESGKMATPNCPKEKVKTGTFFRNNVPQESCDIHGEGLFW